MQWGGRYYYYGSWLAYFNYRKIQMKEGGTGGHVIPIIGANGFNDLSLL